MNRYRRTRVTVVVVLALAALFQARATTQTLKPKKTYQPNLPKCTGVQFEPGFERPGVKVLKEGSILVCRLKKPLSSRTAKIGDTIEAWVTTPITDSAGVLYVPRNSTVSGRVERVQRARFRRSAIIEVGFDSLQRCIVPNNYMGRTKERSGCYKDVVQLAGVLIPLTEENCRDFDQERFVQNSRARGKRGFAFIGGGAGGGAVIGAITTGALLGGAVGAGIGAGVGTLASLINKGREAELAAGLKFGVELTHPLPLRSPWQELTQPKTRPTPRPSPRPTPTPGQSDLLRNRQQFNRLAARLAALANDYENYQYGRNATDTRFQDELNRVQAAIAAGVNAGSVTAQREAIRRAARETSSVNGLLRALSLSTVPDRYRTIWRDIERDIENLATTLGI